MMSKKLLGSFFFIFLFHIILTNNNKNKTLVLIEDWHVVDTHSRFWNQIREMNNDIYFKMVDDPDIKLTNFGEYIYNNIIYFAPSYNDISRKNEISITNLLQFIDDGHDLMIFGNEESGAFIRKLVNEFGIDFDDYDSKVKDSIYIHKNKNDLNSEFADLKNDEIIITNNITDIQHLKKNIKNYILYEGIGMDIDPQNNFVFPILKAGENAYSINLKNDNIYSNGNHIKLVSAYQARNNRRIVISGSTNLCSNKFYYLSNKDYNSNKSPNEEFCQNLLEWNFQITGVLKFENIRHRRINDNITLPTYRIRDELIYEIDIYEYNPNNKNWEPYNTNDIQVEYVMMNPYYIGNLKKYDSSKPTYYTKFTSPDKFGVFKFIIDYERKGYSNIFSSTKVPLRPYYHNEYNRFLPCAYPYYTAVFIILGAFVLFSILFLYGEKKEDKNI